MKLLVSGRHQATIWLVLCFVFSYYYVTRTHAGDNSSIAQHALLAIEPPFVFRLLLPWALHQILPLEWLDLNYTRTLHASFFSFSSVSLMPSFMARILDRPLTSDECARARLAGFVILIAHFVLPRNLKFYYVYDFPAMTFYQLSFLALTHPSQKRRWVGVAITALFAVNRETVGVAVIHAATWHGEQLLRTKQREFRKWLSVCAPLALSAASVLIARGLISHALSLPAQASFSWMDGEQFRLFANLQRMATKHHHAIAAIWFGAGALIWLPKKWQYFDSRFKALLLASSPVFVFYCIVGNFVELRMFSELIPILAVGLALPRRVNTTGQSTSP